MSKKLGSNFYIGYLAQALTEGGSETTIYVDRLTTLTGETISTADFSDLTSGILTINPDGDGVSSYPENISFTGVDSTNIAFTTCVRGLSSKDTTVVTANKHYYPIGTPVIISWGIHFWGQLKDYVDAAVSGFTSFYAPGTAGETVAAGNLVYLKSADGRWWLADADTASTVENVMLGIAQGSGTAGASITSGVLVFGYDQNQSGMTGGNTMYASNTAGGISSSVGTKTVAIGVARTATTLYFNPRFSQQLTADQQAALASTTTPSSTNKYISQKDLQKGAEIYAADSVGTDTYAITLSPAPSAYVTGMVLNFKAGTANTGAATLNVNSLGAITIKKNHDQDLSDNDIEVGQIVTVVYDGTNFQMQSQIANTPIQKVGASTTPVSVNTTASDTNLFSLSIPANTLGTTGTVIARIYVSALGTTGASPTFIMKLKYGATTIYTSSTLTLAFTGPVRGFIEVVLQANAATSAQKGNLYFLANADTTAAAPSVIMIGNGTAAEDSTAAKNLIVSVTWGTSNLSNNITMDSYIVYQLP